MVRNSLPSDFLARDGFVILIPTLKSIPDIPTGTLSMFVGQEFSATVAERLGIIGCTESLS